MLRFSLHPTTSFTKTLQMAYRATLFFYLAILGALLMPQAKAIQIPKPAVFHPDPFGELAEIPGRVLETPGQIRQIPDKIHRIPEKIGRIPGKISHVAQKINPFHGLEPLWWPKVGKEEDPAVVHGGDRFATNDPKPTRPKLPVFTPPSMYEYFPTLKGLPQRKVPQQRRAVIETRASAAVAAVENAQRRLGGDFLDGGFWEGGGFLDGDSDYEVLAVSPLPVPTTLVKMVRESAAASEEPQVTEAAVLS